MPRGDKSKYTHKQDRKAGTAAEREAAPGARLRPGHPTAHRGGRLGGAAFVAAFRLRRKSRRDAEEKF
jgi:hypothetical protein